MASMVPVTSRPRQDLSLSDQISFLCMEMDQQFFPELIGEVPSLGEMYIGQSVNENGGNRASIHFTTRLRQTLTRDRVPH